MSKLTGGLFSRPSGKNSGLVFSSARTSRGKRATARNYVIPTQPDSPGQLLTKQKMKAVAFIYNQLPEQIRKDDLKNLPNAISGYVALSKLFMPLVGYPPVGFIGNTVLNFGSLHFPRTSQVFRSNNPSEFIVNWSTELGGNGSADDLFNFFYIRWGQGITEPSDYVVASGIDVARRSDGGGTFLLPDFSGAFGVAVWYFRGADSNQLSAALMQVPPMQT